MRQLNDITIGVWNDYEDTCTVTVSELSSRQHNHPWYKMEDYFDRRKSTNLSRFIFDPYTGEEIPWKELKLKYKDND